MTEPYVYNPLERNTYEAIAYNAVGRASEINTYPALHLTHSTGKSGWSVGSVQWDFGQPGRGDKVNDLLAGYQAWAAEGQRFTDAEVTSLTGRLQTRGQTGNALTDEEQARLNGYLRSDPGRGFVEGLNQEQIQRKWDNVGQPLSQIDWLQRLSVQDPGQAAEIVAMASKLYNQNENKGGQLIRHLQANEISSTQTKDWIGVQGIDGLNASAQSAIVSGRDKALSGIHLMNALELGDGPLSRMWREEIHTYRDVNLSRVFNGTPEVQLLDGLMRNPVNGEQIRAYVDDGAALRPTVITGINEAARLEMSRTELDKDGQLSVRNPLGQTYGLTPEGWRRTDIEPVIRRDADAPDHTERGQALPVAPSDPNGRTSQLLDPTHPDFALSQQVRAGVERLDAQQGRTFDTSSERMTMSLLVLAKESGLKRVDEVVLNRETATLAAGSTAFVVEGSRSDPGMFRASMLVDLAVRTPVAESHQRLESVNQHFTQQQALAQQESLSRGADEVSRTAPRMMG